MSNDCGVRCEGSHDLVGQQDIETACIKSQVKSDKTSLKCQVTWPHKKVQSPTGYSSTGHVHNFTTPTSFTAQCRLL